MSGPDRGRLVRGPELLYDSSASPLPVDHLHADTEFEIVDEQAERTHVRVPGGIEGWVSASAVVRRLPRL